MTQIRKLLLDLCPTGVPYLTLREVAAIGTGSSNRNESTSEGLYPFYVRSKEIRRIDSYEFDETAIVIPGEGGVGDIFHFVEGKYALHQRAYRIAFHDERVLPKFAYYYLKVDFKVFIKAKAVDGTVTSIRKPMIEDFRIPVPPLVVQQKIVDVLDTFTELEAELEAELESRKLQFEFYRECYFNFNRDISFQSLGSLCDVGDGLHGTPKYSDTGDYHFINGNNLRNGEICFDASTKRVDSTVYAQNGISFDETSTVFMSINGTIGNLSLYRGQNIVLGKSVGYFKTNSQKLNAKYLFFLLQTDFAKAYFARQLTGSTIRNLGLKALRNFEIPCPPLEEQENIVRSIEKFEDLAIRELPAEIKARRLQFEYYRNKLLTFKELEMA